MQHTTHVPPVDFRTNGHTAFAARRTLDGIPGQQRKSADPRQAVEDAVRHAIRAEQDGLPTHPRETADRLHHVIDDESARHLAIVGQHSLDKAFSNERFGTANRAIKDALQHSSDRALTARALRTALEMLIAEVGE